MNLRLPLVLLCLFTLSPVVCRTACAQAKSFPAMPQVPDRRFDAASFGVVGDGKTDNTAAIQRAIDACAKAGGGTVTLPAGAVLSGPLVLRSRLNLVVGRDTVLRMLPYGAYPGTSSFPHFLHGNRLHDVMITGAGTIDGQGKAWWDAYRATPGMKRPAFIRFDSCERVAVVGVTLVNPPNAHISVSQGTSHTTIIGVTIATPPPAPNTDGIDIWGPHVLVAGCAIECGDDNIALDAGKSSGAQDLTITHCTFGPGHGMSIGSYVGGAGIRDLTVEECTFDRTDTPVRMKTSRERAGRVENLYYRSLAATGVKRAIFISSYYPDKTIPTDPQTVQKRALSPTTPVWANIKLNHVTASCVTEAGWVVALPEAPVEGLVLNDVHLSAPTGLRLWHAGGVALDGATITTESGAPTATYDSSVASGPVEPGVNLTTSPGVRTVTAGESATYAVSVQTYGNIGQSPTLAIHGLPAGAKGVARAGTTASTAIMEIVTSSTMRPGIYPLRLTATASGHTSDSTIVLMVNDSPGR